jgi:hypothetical protein
VVRRRNCIDTHDIEVVYDSLMTWTCWNINSNRNGT